MLENKLIKDGLPVKRTNLVVVTLLVVLIVILFIKLYVYKYIWRPIQEFHLKIHRDSVSHSLKISITVYDGLTGVLLLSIEIKSHTCVTSILFDVN